MFPLGSLQPEISQQEDESRKDAEQQRAVLLRFYPELVEEVDASEDLDRCPEDDHRRHGHADVGPPCGDVELAAEHEERPDEAADAHEIGHRMVVAEEVLVVAEHQQEVERPEDHVQLHEGDDGGVVRHGLHDDFVLVRAEELFLNPRDEVAAVARAEDVHRHHHHPQPEGGRHDEVFRFRDDDAVLYLGLHAVAAGIIKEEELHPAGPEEQAAEESPERLAGVAFDEHADDDHHQSCEAHHEAGIMYGLGLHELLHQDHEGMAQRHREQYENERGERAPPVCLFLFHCL